jgi:hypothetical protein
MKTCYDRLVNYTSFHEGDREWLYRLTHTKGKSPQLETPLEGPHKVFSLIIDVVCRIQRNPRSRLMVVHLDRLVPYQETVLDERP